LDATYANELSTGMIPIMAEYGDEIDQLEHYIEKIKIVFEEEHEDIQARPIQPEFRVPSLDL